MTELEQLIITFKKGVSVSFFFLLVPYLLSHILLIVLAQYLRQAISYAP
jgi:hypothetical protein